MAGFFRTIYSKVRHYLLPAALLLSVAFVICSILSVQLSRRGLEIYLRGQLSTQEAHSLHILNGEIAPEQEELIFAPSSDSRFTLYDRTGEPIIDSRYPVANLVNQSHTKEYKEASEVGLGYRYQFETEGTLGEYLRYMLRLQDDTGQTVGYLRAIHPVSAAAEERGSLFTKMFIPFSLALLLTGLPAWYLFRLQIRSVEQLVSNMRDVREGDYSRTLDIVPDSQIGTIAVTINQLLETLEQQHKVILDQRHQHTVLLGSMSEGILAVDPEYIIREINDNAANWLETPPPAKTVGENLHAFNRHPVLTGMIRELLQTRQPHEEDMPILTAEGRDQRILHVRGTLMADAESTIGVLIVLRDVTALRKLQTLRQDFVANVSHELRTPLTSVRGYAELLADTCEDDTQDSRFVNKILTQTERMIAIINDLLELTRIEGQQDHPSFSETEIAPILEQATQACEEQAQSRHIEICLDVDEGLRAYVHSPLLEQAVMNLVQNAVKYTHPNTEVLVSAHVTNEILTIKVKDAGPGIPPVHHNRLFERFYRVDKARSRNVGGTGLGLSIVKHIAQAHNGGVRVDSAPGRGATFTLQIPTKNPESGRDESLESVT